MTKYELGQMAGKIVVMLYQENQDMIKNYGQLHHFISGNVLSGMFPVINTVPIMLSYSKSDTSRKAIHKFTQVITTRCLSKFSFYRLAGHGPNKDDLWLGKDFEAGYIDAIMEIAALGKS